VVIDWGDIGFSTIPTDSEIFKEGPGLKIRIAKSCRP
jgi:hypothetical protein